MNEDQWFQEYGAAQDDLHRDGDVDRFRRRLAALGLDPGEIDEEVTDAQT